MNQNQKKPDPIADYAAQTMAVDGPALVRAPELESDDGSGRKFYVTARHTAVKKVLEEEASFSLQHYDELLSEVAGKVRFLLGVGSPERAVRVAMLRAAQMHVASNIASGEPPQNNAYLDWIAATTRQQAQQVLRILRRSRGIGGRVNFVREYSYLVTYLTARQVFGIPGPDKPPPLIRLMMLARNFMAKGRWIRMRGELGSAMSMFGLYHLIFGHLFGAGKGKSFIQKLAGSASKSYLKLLRQVNAGKYPIPKDSLQAAFGSVRGAFPETSDDDYWSHVIAIQYELVSAMTLLVGTALARIAGLLVAPEGEPPGITWDGAIAALDEAGRAGNAGQDIINELLRLSGGTRLLRTVTQSIDIEGIRLNPGDKVMTLNDFANFDPRVFDDPYRYKLGRAEELLTFGPIAGPHACYGRFIARTMLREMLLNADKIMKPVAGTSLEAFLVMPDNLEFEIKPEAPLGFSSDAASSSTGVAR